MTSLHALAVGIAGLGLASAISPQVEEPRPVVPTTQRVDVERDLELVAHIEGTPPVHSWWPLSITVEIVNRSGSTSYPIVLPGDGSDAGWREPHVYFTTEVRAQDGTWSTVPRRGGLRCGNYDPYWLDEIVQLAPGASQRLQWVHMPGLPDQGATRLRAHYVYTAQPPGPRWSETDRSQPLGFGEMAGVEPFELVSAPLEFVLAPPAATRAEIERDLALEVVREAAGPSHSWELQHFRAQLTNHSATRAHRVVQPRLARESRCDEPRISEFVRVEFGGGKWQTASKLMGGFYDGALESRFERSEQLDWRTQVIELLPGESIDFDLRTAVTLYDFLEARTAAMVIEYAYDGRPICDAKGMSAAAPAAFGAMADIPPFRIRSGEITWPVRSPLRLDIVLRADRDPSSASNLSDCVRIVLRNAGDEPFEISNPERAAKLAVSASQLVLGGTVVDVRGTLAIGRLVIPARGELSLLEEPAVDLRSLSTYARPAGSRFPSEKKRVEALLHRPGWIHSFSAVHEFATK